MMGASMRCSIFFTVVQDDPLTQKMLIFLKQMLLSGNPGRKIISAILKGILAIDFVPASEILVPPDLDVFGKIVELRPTLHHD